MHGINETLTWQKHLHEASLAVLYFGSLECFSVQKAVVLCAEDCNQSV